MEAATGIVFELRGSSVPALKDKRVGQVIVKGIETFFTELGIPLTIQPIARGFVDLIPERIVGKINFKIIIPIAVAVKACNGLGRTIQGVVNRIFLAEQIPASGGGIEGKLFLKFFGEVACGVIGVGKSFVVFP